MSYTIAHEIAEYWDEFVDSAYLPDGLSGHELRELCEAVYLVELAITLMQALGLSDQPLELLPSLVNWTAVNYRDYAGIADPALLKRNALRLQPLRSVNNWSQTLAAYLSLPIGMRLFDLPELEPTDLSRQVMQSLSFNDVTVCGYPERFSHLQETLYHPLKRVEQQFALVQQPGIHQAWVNGIRLEFDLHDSDITGAERQFDSFPVLESQRSGVPRNISLALPDGLRSVAERLGTPWPALLASINFRAFDGQQLSPTNALPLKLDDSQPFLHLVGMTGARKSVLATLLAAWAIERTLDTGQMHRVVLAFTTVSEALARAELLNRAFRGALDEPPVAVPIFGEGGREKQLLRFFDSAELTDSQEHWAERFLASSCRLQARLTVASRQALAGQSIPAGAEPCTRLKNTIRPSMTYVCPFFAACPSRRRYADLVGAPVWIVNPWTFAFTRIPQPLLRVEGTQRAPSLRVMELIASHADLMIVDEGDVAQSALDSIWGPTYRLYGGRAGLYDANITAVAAHDQRQRVESAGHPWVRSFVSGWEAVNVTSAMLTDARHGPALLDWVTPDFFTLEYLLYRLTRKLAGLPAGTLLPTDKQQLLEERFGELAGNLLDILRAVMGGAPVPDDEPQLEEARRELLALRRALLSTSNHRHMRVRRLAREWLNKWVLAPQNMWPPYEARVREIVGFLGWSGYKAEPAERLEALLLFALALSNLRYYTLLVTEQWESRPEIAGFNAEAMARAPYYADGLLPAPPLGQMFGFRIQRQAAVEGDDGIIIQAAEHRAIGRGALFELPHLREAVEGIPGPRVMTLSATSYMPGSAKFHQHVPPAGVLEPYPPGASQEMAKHPVAQSVLVFQPVRDADGEPIFISGRPDKEERLRRMVSQMTTKLLPDLLQDLAYRARKEPNSWGDRERIVLFPNSYQQAEAMALPLAMCGIFDRVFLLARESLILPHDIKTVTLTDVETVGRQTFGERVALIAPLQAIGRGLNILNQAEQAAFGAAVFATRYYPPPGGFATIVEAVHAATYQGKDRTGDSAYHNLRKMRNRIRRVKAAAEVDAPYSRLSRAERKMLAADTTALISQAVGRLVRGTPDMVPFIAYFTDAAWAPHSASGEMDTPESSLLLAMRDYMADLVSSDPVFRAAHGPLFHAVNQIKGVYHA